MKTVNLLLVIGLVTYGVMGLTGCTVRTYSLTKDRIDQDLSGNRGYLQGIAPAQVGKRKTQRTTQVIEIEFGPAAEVKKPVGKAVPAQEMIKPTEVPASESLVSEPEIAPVTANFKEYKVQKADTLQKISLKFYGTTQKWNKIYQANKDRLRGPDKIYPGQIINIPLEELKEPKENLK